MRAALSSIQQTLTPQAASVLNHSIAEAGRRNHGQTTPLHVAETLLASPSGFLRQACIRSHPNSSHPLQCRALELCFSVALDRLPTVQTAAAEPPISNALLAALKRAQANQRRGCPEQQQQPLLAVKVELEQLIVSILDDPSVSRVMREASFSSPAVKATIEQSLNASAAPPPHHVAGGNPNFGTIGGRMIPNPSPPVPISSHRNMYLNPRLQQGAAAHIGNQKGEEVKKVLEIMGRTKKRNPILVGDTEPEVMVKEFFTKIQNKELGNDGILKNVHLISIDKGLLSDKSQIAAKINELGELIRSRIRTGGVILDLGNLKWLVEHPVSFGGPQQKQQLVSELGRVAVVEMAKLVAMFDGGDMGNEANKLWLLGTATCETFLRCQVYHSTMENDWDLQAIPITSRSPPPGAFPRLLGGPLDTLNSLKTVPAPLPAFVRPVSETLDPSQNSTLCPQCSVNHDKELAKLAAIEKSFTDAKEEANRSSMPQWLQNARLNNADPKAIDEVPGKDQGVLYKQKTQELQKKWRDTCLHLHPNFHSDRAGPPSLSMPSLYNSNLLLRAPFQLKSQMVKPLREALKLNMTPVTTSQLADSANGPPGSPVRTDLVLGRKEPDSVCEKVTENQAKDLLGCISFEPATKLLEKFSDAFDADTYKKLLKGLMEKSWWQAEAASAVASAITRCRLGNGKRRAGSRGDIWLLFTGPDRVGKKKMGFVLAEQICGSNPIMICLGKRRDEEEIDMNFRGKTAIDRIAEAVRRNPFSVIMLEDIDEADILVQSSIKRAVERGRLTDSHGREVGLGNTIFLITGDWSTTNPEALRDGCFVDDKKLALAGGGGWQLGLSVREKSAKRRANWLCNGEDQSLKPRKEMPLSLSLDLSLAAACNDDDRPDGSHISSDLTVEDELGLVSQNFSVTLVPHELVTNVDDSIVFKPVDSSFIRREIRKTIAMKFSMAVDENLSIEVGDNVLEKILGGLWHDRTSLEEWVDNVLAPSFDQLKARLPGGDRSSFVARLVVESSFGDVGKSNGNANWLPSSIIV